MIEPALEGLHAVLRNSKVESSEAPDFRVLAWFPGMHQNLRIPECISEAASSGIPVADLRGAVRISKRRQQPLVQTCARNSHFNVSKVSERPVTHCAAQSWHHVSYVREVIGHDIRKNQPWLSKYTGRPSISVPLTTELCVRVGCSTSGNAVDCVAGAVLARDRGGAHNRPLTRDKLLLLSVLPNMVWSMYSMG